MDGKIKTALCIFLLMASATGVRSDDLCELGPINFTLNCSVDYVRLNAVAEIIMDTHFFENLSNCGAAVINNCSKDTKFNMPKDNSSGCDPTMTQKWNLPVCFDTTDRVINIHYIDRKHVYACQIKTACKFRALNTTIFMKSFPDKAIISKPYWIHCIVTTSEKVNSSIVEIDWRGPDGSIINNSRITIKPTASDNGIMHNSSLQFLNISQDDIGTFTCDVTILDTHKSEVLQLDNFTRSVLTTSSMYKLLPTTRTAPKETTTGIIANPSVATQNGSVLATSSMYKLLPTTRTAPMEATTGIIANPSVATQNGSVLATSSMYKLLPTTRTAPKETTTGIIANPSVATQNGSVLATSSMYKLLPTTITAPKETTTGIIANPSVATQNGSVLATSSMNTLLPTTITETATGTTANPSVGDNAQQNAAALSAFIISTVIGLLFIIVLISMFVYKLRSRMQLRICYSSNDNLQFKIPSISEIPYSIPYNDNASTCESLNTNYKVAQWIKSKQLSNLNESCDDIYPSNEEILNYVCGQNFLCHDSKHINKNVECDELLNTEEESIDSIDIQQPVQCIASRMHHEVGPVDDKSFNDDITNLHDHHDLHDKVALLRVTLNTSTKSVPDKMYVMYNTTHCWYLSQIDKDNNSNFPHYCYNTTAKYDDSVQQANSFPQSTKYKCKGAVSEEVVNFGLPSQVSSDELTENILAPSVSSQSSLIVGDYIETKTPMWSVIDLAYTENKPPGKDNVDYIPTQSKNFHQRAMLPLNETLLTNAAMKSEYVDYNTAILQAETSETS